MWSAIPIRGLVDDVERRWGSIMLVLRWTMSWLICWVRGGQSLSDQWGEHPCGTALTPASRWWGVGDRGLRVLGQLRPVGRLGPGSLVLHHLARVCPGRNLTCVRTCGLGRVGPRPQDAAPRKRDRSADSVGSTGSGSAGGRGGTFKTRCYNCHQKGHHFSECPERPSQPAVTVSAVPAVASAGVAPSRDAKAAAVVEPQQCFEEVRSYSHGGFRGGPDTESCGGGGHGGGWWRSGASSGGLPWSAIVSFATGGGFACVAGGQARCNRAESVSSFAGDWAGGPALPGDFSWWEVSAFGDGSEWGEPVARALCGAQVSVRWAWVSGGASAACVRISGRGPWCCPSWRGGRVSAATRCVLWCPSSECAGYGGLW